MLTQQNVSIKRLWLWVGAFVGLSIGSYFGIQAGLADGLDVGIAQGRELGGIEMKLHLVKKDRIRDAVR